MADLITLEYLKTLVASDSTTSDSIWNRLISAASTAFLNKTNRRTIASQSFTETRDGDGSGSLILRAFPLISIASLSVDGRAQAAYTGSGSGYVVADNGFAVELLGRTLFTAGRRNVAITYTAGYATIPDDIQEAVAEMCIWKKTKNPRLDLTSQTLQGMETISYSQADIPPAAKGVIAQYWIPGGWRSS